MLLFLVEKKKFGREKNITSPPPMVLNVRPLVLLPT